MSILGTIISVGISVCVILVFRYMDRNGRSLEKVKKYIDLKSADLQSLFSEQQQKLNAVSAGLEEKKSQAIATVHRLEKQISEFDTITNEFSARINAVDEIDKKIL